MPADRFAAGHSLIKTISSPVLANVTRMVLWNGIKRDTIAMNKEMANKYPSTSLTPIISFVAVTYYRVYWVAICAASS